MQDQFPLALPSPPGYDQGHGRAKAEPALLRVRRRVRIGMACGSLGDRASLARHCPCAAGPFGTALHLVDEFSRPIEAPARRSLTYVNSDVLSENAIGKENVPLPVADLARLFADR